MPGDLRSLIDHSKRLIQTRSKQGLSAALEMEVNNGGINAPDRVLADLQEITNEEHRLLTLRSALAESDFRNTEYLLLCACTLAAILLALANVLASRAMGRQKHLTRKAQMGGAGKE